MVKYGKQMIFIIILFFIVAGTAQGQTVFLARKALGAVSHLTSEITGYGKDQGPQQQKGRGPEVATVLLEANADKVYTTALKVLENNKTFQITYRNDKARTVEFSDGDRLANMKVSRLDEKLCQLIIGASTTSGKPANTSFVVDGVFRVCKDMGIQCVLSND